MKYFASLLFFVSAISVVYGGACRGSKTCDDGTRASCSLDLSSGQTCQIDDEAGSITCTVYGADGLVVGNPYISLCWDFAPPLR